MELSAEGFAKVWFKLSRDYHTYMESALAPDLTEAQLVVLEYIIDHGQVKPSDLIDFLATTPAAISTLLDRMMKNGLIERERDKHDRRIVRILVTPKGLEAARRGIQIRNRFLERGLEPISRHNQKLLVYLLEKIDLKERV